MAGWGCLHRHGAEGRGLLPPQPASGHALPPAARCRHEVKRWERNEDTPESVPALGDVGSLQPMAAQLCHPCLAASTGKGQLTSRTHEQPEMGAHHPSFLWVTPLFQPLHARPEAIRLLSLLHRAPSSRLCHTPQSFLPLQQHFQYN